MKVVVTSSKRMREPKRIVTSLTAIISFNFILGRGGMRKRERIFLLGAEDAPRRSRGTGAAEGSPKEKEDGKIAHPKRRVIFGRVLH